MGFFLLLLQRIATLLAAIASFSQAWPISFPPPFQIEMAKGESSSLCLTFFPHPFLFSPSRPGSPVVEVSCLRIARSLASTLALLSCSRSLARALSLSLSLSLSRSRSRSLALSPLLVVVLSLSRARALSLLSLLSLSPSLTDLQSLLGCQ